MKHPQSLSEAFVFGKRELDDMAAAQPALALVDRIFLVIREGIRTQRILQGAKLPSIRDVAQACEVSRDTVTRAYDKLVAHGYLMTRPGAGFYVRSADLLPTGPAATQASRAQTDFHTPADWRQRLLDPGASLSGNLGSGDLPSAWLDEPHLAGALRSVARGNLNWMAGLGDLLGYLPLRQQLQIMLKEFGLNVEPRQLLTTIGATDALSVITTSYLRSPGAVVLVDDPASFLLLDRLMASGLTAVGIPREDDGPDISALRSACMRHRPSFLFCNSLLHSPTSMSLAPHKAFQILRLAEEFDLTIVEDDTYGDLLPTSASARYTRLATLDQLRRVIYIGSFSKTLGPGLRVGYIAAASPRIDWMLRYKSVSRAGNGSLAERTVFRLLTEGTYRHHCEQLRVRLDVHRQKLLAKLDALNIAVESRPDAGMYLWGRLPNGVGAMSLADRMLQRGYLTAPGPLFSISREGDSYMRFNVAASDDEAAFRALRESLA
jgi:DNA-binding transcriptional MocR family regulator